MLDPQTDMEWIDGFLQRKLSKLELADFQKRLTTDTAFAAIFLARKAKNEPE